MGALATLLDVIGTACCVAGFIADHRRREDLGNLLWGITNVAYIPGDITGLNWRWLLPLNVVVGVFFLVQWWRKRKRRDRAPRSYGAKSRALLAAVVAKMRETAKPRPVFRPAPGGSGAA